MFEEIPKNRIYAYARVSLKFQEYNSFLHTLAALLRAKALLTESLVKISTPMA